LRAIILAGDAPRFKRSTHEGVQCQQRRAFLESGAAAKSFHWIQLKESRRCIHDQSQK
jgi:hypothetical protein